MTNPTYRYIYIYIDHSSLSYTIVHYNVHYTIHSYTYFGECQYDSVHCTLYTIHCTLHCTVVYTVQCTMYPVQGTVYIVKSKTHAAIESRELEI